MDHIATPERSREEVYTPHTAAAGSRRFSGAAVLAAVAAAVLGVSALGGAAVTQTGFADLAAGSSAVQAAESGAVPPGMAPPEGEGGHGGGHQAPPAGGAAGSAGQQQATTHEVGMAGLLFSPENLTVAAGDTVTWINDDTVPHTVTATDGPEIFESELLNPGDTFSFTFTMPGEYSYYCAVHPNMKATVLVGEGAAAGPAPGDGAPPPAEPAPADPAPADPAPAQPPGGDSADCVPSTAFDEFMRHVEFAHLQTSPDQQVEDLADVDQYMLVHMVLVNDMLQPVFGGVTTDATATSLDAFWRHMEVAHFQRSPLGQVEDLLDTDQYVQTHTVLVQDMLSPHVDYTAC